MDGFNFESVSELNHVIEDIVMMQKKTCVIDVTCECGQIHRVPLDGYRICQCGRKFMSQIFTNMTDRCEGL